MTTLHCHYHDIMTVLNNLPKSHLHMLKSKTPWCLYLTLELLKQVLPAGMKE